MSKQQEVKIEDKIELWDMDKVIPYENNIKDHPKKQVEALADRILEEGFNQPIVVDMQGVIIKGHGRRLAAIHLDLKQVPVIRLNLSDKQARLARIADNRIAESEWLEELLKMEFEHLEKLGVDLTETGFSKEEIDKINNLFVEHSEVEEDEFDEVPPEVPDSKSGDLYELIDEEAGLSHRVLCGDSTKESHLQNLIGDHKADMWLTDPPYNVDYEGKTKDSLKIENDSMADGEFRAFLINAYQAADKALKPGASFYIWHADSEGYNFRGAAKDIGWQVRQCLVWVKNAIVLGRQDYHWQHEPCLYGWTNGTHKWYADRKQSTILKFNKPNRNGEHPTMKPVELFAYLIQNNSREHDVILDSFGGSGTTLIASQQLNRRAFLMEFDPRYCDVIVKRWAKFMNDHNKPYKLMKNGAPFTLEEVSDAA